MDEAEAMGDQYTEQAVGEEMPELVVCIERYADGKVRVGLEGEGDDAGMQDVGSVGEALKVAQGLLEPKQSPEEADAFTAGFNKTVAMP